MPRASGNDLCEIFGYAPDDRTDVARRQWKSQECPFVGGICVKHSHPQEDGDVVVYGSCSVVNRGRVGVEEVIICPQRLYACAYGSLKGCAYDALGMEPPVYLAHEYSALKRRKAIPDEYVVLLGQKSGGEVSLSNPGVIELSLDWVMAHVKDRKLESVIPCEVQSIDITGNYRANWQAYSQERPRIPDSKHGMNWANVWKRLIPQLILKGAIASTSTLCRKGIYFIVPDRVYVQFEKLVGNVPQAASPAHGVMTVMTYALGPDVAHGSVRDLARVRSVRMLATDFAKAFGSGSQLPLGTQLDKKVAEILNAL